MIKWCFSTLGCADRSLSDVISLAERYGISALEIRGIGGELKNEKISDFSVENTEKTKKIFADANILPLILGTSVSFHDEDLLEKNLAEAEASLQIASRIGFSAIRVFGNSIVGDETECISRVASGISRLCRIAEKIGVSVFLEVHGDFNTIERILPIAELCCGIGSFGIIWDICHTHSAYNQNWRVFYDALEPYIRHVHIKDVFSGKQVLPGDGELPIREVIEYLSAKGYNGYFSLEWEKYWHRDLPEIEEALDKLFSLFKYK